MMPAGNGGWRPNGTCPLLVCDIASFGHPSRTDDVRLHMRKALYTGLRRSLDAERIRFDLCYHEDRGDGVMLALPPGTDTAVLLTTLVERIRAEVRKHNGVSSEAAQMQLRVAVNTGDVRSDSEGLIGTAVNHTFRILEAPQLKLALLRTGADLALIASHRVYEDVIRHGIGMVDPGEYERVEVSVKETAAYAWIRVPGLRAPVLTVLNGMVTAIDARALSQPRQLPPATATLVDPVTLIDPATDLFEIVDLALEVRLLQMAHGRSQIIAELPLALAVSIERQEDDTWEDMYAIVQACHERQDGLTELVRVIRQFTGDSNPLRQLEESVARLGQG